MSKAKELIDAQIQEITVGQARVLDDVKDFVYSGVEKVLRDAERKFGIKRYIAWDGFEKPRGRGVEQKLSVSLFIE